MRRWLFVLFGLSFVYGCGGSESYSIVIEFPEPVTESKEATEILRVYSLLFVGDGASCKSLIDGDTKPTDNAVYQIEDQRDISKPFTAPIDPIKVDTNETRTRVFFSQGEGTGGRVFFRGCAEATIGGSRTHKANITLASCKLSCPLGRENCDDKPGNGCEADLTGTANCGSCGNTCTSQHSSTACISGACKPTCDASWADCDGNPSNGCETDLTSPSGCNGRATTCSFSGGAMACGCTAAYGGAHCDQCAVGYIGYPDCHLPVTGEAQNYSIGGIGFDMRYVPGGTFPTGTGTQTTAGSGAVDATVSTPFWIGETEVTYELWYKVHKWALSNGYTFGNQGREGNDGTDGAEPTGAKNEPVTVINWRDAMVWCNALTSYYNANNGSDPDLDYVYYTDAEYTTSIRSVDDSGTITANPGVEDNPYIKATASGNTDMANCIAKGFRLPGSMEWECAARYKDGTNWTAGTFASGATADYSNFSASDSVAWFGNSLVSGTGNTTSTKPVAGRSANLLGLRDMSGNVWEWCFDWHPNYNGSYRVLRGGSWFSSAVYLQVGVVRDDHPADGNGDIGFRLSRTP